MNAYNGFLLCAHLDALFDRGLITFDSEGAAVFSDELAEEVREQLDLGDQLKLRWATEAHQAFLEYHRDKVFRG